MTSINWGALEAFTRDLVEPGIKDQIFVTSPFLTLMDQKGIKERSGKNIRVLVQYGKNSGAGSYAGGDILPTVRTDKFGDTYLPWKQAQSGPIVLNGDEEFKNSGPEEIADIVQAEVDNAKESLRDVLATALYTDGTGNSSKDLTGLIAAVDDSSNVGTYAGIARGTYTWWKSRYTSWAATEMTLNALHIETQALTDGGISPDYVVCDNDFYNKMYELVLPMQRQQNDGMARAGFSNIVVDGRTIVVDTYAGATDAWILNTRYLEMYGAKGRHFTMEPFQKPVNQDARISRILWAGQLVNTSCRRHGRIHSYNTAL